MIECNMFSDGLFTGQLKQDISREDFEKCNIFQTDSYYNEMKNVQCVNRPVFRFDCEDTSTSKIWKEYKIKLVVRDIGYWVPLDYFEEKSFD